jgi:predicted AAA+ superfamily ATPase
MESVGRFFQPPAGSFFLLGPRGTGKSWWTRRAFPSALVVDLLDPATERRLVARPEALEALVEGMEKPGPVIIDEIQKLPALLDVVHRLIERKRGWRFILTGSSARKLRRGGVNLLGGRAANAACFPFLAGELGDRFDLADALVLGLVPGIRAAADPPRALEAYGALYIREEVQAERLVRNVGDFARFLEAVSFAHGAQLNLANVARECEVERKTVDAFVGILEDLLLAERVPPFTKRAKRALSSHPKFYFFDAGVYRSFRPAGPMDRPEEIAGAALEGLVWQHLRAWQAWGATTKRTIGFWRTRRGLEVDFVVQAPGELVAIEVKHAARVRDSDLTSLRAFADDYPEARTVLLYRGTERLKEKNVLCVPVESFLARLHPQRSLADALGIRT